MRNRCPSRVIDYSMSYQLWIGKILSARHLYIFGSKAFVLNKYPLSKFEARAQKGIFLGSSEISKAYRIWNPRKQQIEIA